MIFQIFTLRCDDCKKPFSEQPHDFSLESHSDVRAEARKRGWARRKDALGQKDYCPACKGMH